MERTEKEIGHLTGHEIVSESHKIFWSNRPLVWLQLALNLPRFICSACIFILLLNSIPSNFLEVVGNPSSLFSNGVPEEGAAWATVAAGTMSEFRDYLMANLPLVLLILISVWPLGAIGALSQSANVYTVGLVFTNRTVSLRSVLTGAARSWPRMIITLLCCQLIVCSGLIVLLGSVWLAVMLFSFRVLFFIQIILITAVFVPRRPILFSAVRFNLACAVSIFEELSGWAALRRAKELLPEEKELVALRANCRYLSIVSVTLIVGLIYNEANHPNDHLNLVGILLVASVLILGAYIQQINSISAGVAYISFTAYHDKIARFSLEQGVVAGEILSGFPNFQSPPANGREEHQALLG